MREQAAKADKADDGRVARLIDGLVDLVPAAIGAVTSTFATPLLGSAAGTATKSALHKLTDAGPSQSQRVVDVDVPVPFSGGLAAVERRGKRRAAQ